MPNTFAYFVLLSWPLVVGWLFAKRPAHEALIWSLLGGYLILPQSTGFNLPMLPTLDKTTLPALAALAFCVFRARNPDARVPRAPEDPAPPRRARGTPRAEKIGWIPQDKLHRLLFLMVFASVVLTMATNGDQLRIGGGRTIKGLELYDLLAAIQATLLTLLPFLLARRYLRTAAHHDDLIRIFLVAGLAYSLPLALEVRLSPQLHNIIYGFYQHSFLQQKRFGGFRPMVFLQHGIWAAVFVGMVLMAAAGRLRMASSDTRMKHIAIVVWISVLLVLCKTASALIPAVLLLPVALFAGKRTQVTAAAAIAVAVAIYPALRGLGLVPVDQLVSMVRDFSQERAGSLNFRLLNEDILLAHAAEKPLFGWGGWNRWRVFDPTNGLDVTTSDGIWAIIFSTNGWFGYIPRFGLLTLPLIMLFAMRRRPELTRSTAALSLVLAINLVDLVPNAGLTPVTWMLAGALLGRIEDIRRTAPASESDGATDAEPSPARPRLAAHARRPAAAGPPYGGGRGTRAFAGDDAPPNTAQPRPAAPKAPPPRSGPVRPPKLVRGDPSRTAATPQRPPKPRRDT